MRWQAMARNQLNWAGYAAASADCQALGASRALARTPPTCFPCDLCSHRKSSSGRSHRSKPEENMSVVSFCHSAPSMHMGKVQHSEPVIFFSADTSARSQTGQCSSVRKSLGRVKSP
eukprot:6189738-Prymnesium_polylepis.1